MAPNEETMASLSLNSNTGFAGKRVLVTGGGRGIGYDIAKRFHEHGAKVVVVDKDQGLLDKIVKELPGLITECVDLTNWEAAQAVVTRHSPLDHLVNNAGVLSCLKLVDVTPQNFDIHYAVNVRGAFAVAQAFVKANKEAGHPGTIVNVSSLGDRCAFNGGGIYCSTKAALTRLTEACALEFSQYNIRTNCVNPGFMATEMVTSMDPEWHALNAPTMTRIPIKEPLETRDVVDAVLFLSGPQSRQINGTSLVIDGGCKAAA